MYIGIVELEVAPYRDAVLVNAKTDDEAKEKYEKYCDEKGGYIVNLYRGTEKTKEKYRSVIELCKRLGKEI